MRQHLEHGTSRLDYPVCGKTFAQEILTRNIAVCQVDVADMVNDLPVRLLGYALIKTPVPRLHVKYWYLSSFGGNGGETTVRIPEDEKCLRFFLCQYRVYF